MIDEIRKLDDGKFLLIDKNEEKCDVRRLRTLKQQLEGAQAQAKANLNVIEVNLTKVCEALGKVPPEPTPLEVPVLPQPVVPSTLQDSPVSDPPDPPGVPTEDKKKE